MLESQSPCLISRSLSSSREHESNWVYMTYHLLELTKPPSKKPKSNPNSNTPKSQSHSHSTTKSNNGSDYSNSSSKRSNNGSDYSSNSDSNSLINQIGRDNSIDCLLRCSRSDYGSLACLNRGFRSLIQGGELYRLRRQLGIIEHWVYFSCDVSQWESYDPNRAKWMTLPRIPRDECFMSSDKESLAVGTELLVFGVVFRAQIVFRYSILTNLWTRGVQMNQPRCLFGSASLGEKAIVAGGTDLHGTVLSSAELYNSESQTWSTIPSMNKARRMCSGVFMDRKFYVIGGMSSNTDILTCGEEYDLETSTWRVIPNMSSGLNCVAGAPPLVAVVKNELYAADYTEKVLRRYDKKKNVWITLGPMPERPDSVNGWGVAFRACGERLLVIGGPRAYGAGLIEVNSWVPSNNDDDDMVPRWNIIASKPSASFVYNCAVMGC